MTTPSLDEVQSLAARCIDTADPEVDAGFKLNFGIRPADFIALNEKEQAHHLYWLEAKRFYDGDLVLVRNGVNPQIRFAVGRVEGADRPRERVQVRLLHVLRGWGMDGRHRPDERMIQALHSGLGNYAEFKRGDAMKIPEEEMPSIVQKSASQLAAMLFAQHVPVHPEPGTAVGSNSGIRVKLNPVTEDGRDEFEVEITSGYRAGNVLCHGQSETPLRFPSADQAAQWLSEIGYTLDGPRDWANVMRTTELTGLAFDWAVATATGRIVSGVFAHSDAYGKGQDEYELKCPGPFSPSRWKSTLERVEAKEGVTVDVLLKKTFGETVEVPTWVLRLHTEQLEINARIAAAREARANKPAPVELGQDDSASPSP